MRNRAATIEHGGVPVTSHLDDVIARRSVRQLRVLKLIKGNGATRTCAGDAGAIAHHVARILTGAFANVEIAAVGKIGVNANIAAILGQHQRSGNRNLIGQNLGQGAGVDRHGNHRRRQGQIGRCIGNFDLQHGNEFDVVGRVVQVPDVAVLVGRPIERVQRVPQVVGVGGAQLHFDQRWPIRRQAVHRQQERIVGREISVRLHKWRDVMPVGHAVAVVVPVEEVGYVIAVCIPGGV